MYTNIYTPNNIVNLFFSCYSSLCKLLRCLGSRYIVYSFIQYFTLGVTFFCCFAMKIYHVIISMYILQVCLPCLLLFSVECLKLV